MKARELICFMQRIEKLKCNTRHSWTSTGRQESVAEHSWRLALLAYLSKDEFPDADINRVILMCLSHDLGEAITGDIPAFFKTKQDEVAEGNAVSQLISALPSPYKEELSELFYDMNTLNSTESKIYKALDNLEAILQHNEADISTWIPIEYETNLTYGTQNVAFSNYLKELKQEIRIDSITKIKNEK